MKIFTVAWRNGFGFDLESVDSLPMWAWFEDKEYEEDDADVAMFDGLVLSLPFVKVFVGKLL